MWKFLHPLKDDDLEQIEDCKKKCNRIVVILLKKIH